MTTPVPTDVPGLFALPLPTPFPIGRINTYLARGDNLTLIDTGVNTEKSYGELRTGLATLGVRPADLDRIILTHHHTDHLGLVARLAEESGAEVWCHRRCVPFVSQPAEARAYLRDWSVGVWQEGGVPEGLLALTEQVFRWFEAMSNGPAAVSRVLEDSEIITLLGRDWTVLHTPGHAGDLICLYEPSGGVLLSSDHLLGRVSSNALIEPPDPGQKRPRRLLDYMAQLRRVAELAPRVAYAGHGEPVTDVPALVEARLAFHRQRAEHVLSLLRGSPRSLYDLTESMFAHVTEAEKFLALSEVLGHLDWLERDGRVVRVPQETHTCWQAA
jgi:glyoxylase-like metal-dependent hydrolase (beta-lactamase superfamily II)